MPKIIVCDTTQIAKNVFAKCGLVHVAFILHLPMATYHTSIPRDPHETGNSKYIIPCACPMFNLYSTVAKTLLNIQLGGHWKLGDHVLVVAT